VTPRAIYGGLGSGVRSGLEGEVALGSKWLSEEGPLGRVRGRSEYKDRFNDDGYVMLRSWCCSAATIGRLGGSGKADVYVLLVAQPRCKPHMSEEGRVWSLGLS
jgi:hypothetical protein